MCNDHEMDGIFGDSNAGAYQTREVREGPPLVYMGEKLGIALTDLHRLLSRAGTMSSGPAETAFMAARSAFHNALTAYCALHNMLSLLKDHELVGRLLGLSPGDFEAWVADVANEGSVT